MTKVLDAIGDGGRSSQGIVCDDAFFNCNGMRVRRRELSGRETVRYRRGDLEILG